MESFYEELSGKLDTLERENQRDAKSKEVINYQFRRFLQINSSVPETAIDDSYFRPNDRLQIVSKCKG